MKIEQQEYVVVVLDSAVEDYADAPIGRPDLAALHFLEGLDPDDVLDLPRDYDGLVVVSVLDWDGDAEVWHTFRFRLDAQVDIVPVVEWRAMKAEQQA